MQFPVRDDLPLLLGELGKEKQSSEKDTTWGALLGRNTMKKLSFAYKKRIRISSPYSQSHCAGAERYTKCWWHTGKVEPLCPWNITLYPTWNGSQWKRKNGESVVLCGTFTPQAEMQLSSVQEDTKAAWDAINIKRKTYRHMLSSAHIQPQTFTTLFIQLPSHLAEQCLTEILQG